MQGNVTSAKRSKCKETCQTISTWFSYIVFLNNMLVKEVITIATKSRDVITCVQQIKSYLAKTNAKTNVK